MKRDNKGSTLITVIVAIAFVTILASIILGTTVVNMSMKGIDRRVKDDFYYAERGMSDVFIGVGQVAAEDAGDEYEAAFKQIGTTFETGQEAANEFKATFLAAVLDEFDEADEDDRIALFDKYVVKSYLSTRIKSVAVTGVGEVKFRKTDGSPTDSLDVTKLDEYSGVVIPQVSVTATDHNDYRSTVTSDIVIECPTVDFLGTNAEITDYAIIGCQGVYFTGSGTVDVSGNIYGGVHESANSKDNLIHHSLPSGYTPLYGGINVYGSNVKLKSNYVVSKGDINVMGNGSALTVESVNTSTDIPAVWCDSMRTVSPPAGTTPSSTVTINNANVFALNDLELNANDSTVKIKGDYYGYNDKTIATEDSLAGAVANSGNSLDYDDERVDNDSSAIIINGNHCMLDLSETHTLVLMGKAFVDFSSKGTVPTGFEKVAASAEALALQPNQQLYVVPTDFMTSPNPCTSDNYPAGGFELNKTKSELDTWFGYKYVENQDHTWNADDIVNDIYETYAVDIPMEGGTERVYYAYLKFNDLLWIDNDPDPNKVDYRIAMYRNPENLSEMIPVPKEKLGLGGSVSSKAAFFDEIMTATGDTSTELQPSAYRLREKIKKSITYNQHFNLQSVLVNNSGSEVIYGRNAIVSYDNRPGVSFTPTVRGNTDGLERFAGYPQNLFKRYQLLCVYLNGKEDKALGASIDFTEGEKTKILGGTEEGEAIEGDWVIYHTDPEDSSHSPVTSPMDHFVLLGEMAGVDTTADEDDVYLESDDSNAAFGQCVVKTVAAGSAYTIDEDFKGVAFINGDVEIDGGVTVDGLIMATGTITINGGGTAINANKGIVQSRVDKELSLVEKGSDYEDNFLIKYLTSDGANRIYSVDPGSKREENRIKPDYNSFMHYENWQKGN